MFVRFHHTHGYTWEKVTQDRLQPGDVVATNVADELERRVKIESPHTTSAFEGSALDRQHEAREAAGLPKVSDVSVVCRHLEDCVIAQGHHFDLEDVTAVECDDKDLEPGIAAYFGVPVYEASAEDAEAAQEETV